MPVLGDNKLFKLNDNTNIDDSDDVVEEEEEEEDDEKQPLAIVKQKYLSSSNNKSSKSKKTPPTNSSATKMSSSSPRVVVARPPTSHGSKKRKQKSPSAASATPRNSKKTPTTNSTTNKKSPVIIFSTSSSSSSSDDDEIVLAKIATTPPKKREKDGGGGGGKSASSASTSTSSPTAIRRKHRPSNHHHQPNSPNKKVIYNPFNNSPGSLGRQKRFEAFSARLGKLWLQHKAAPNSNESRKQYTSYAHMVIGTLQRSEMERIPVPEIRDDILKRYEANCDRKKMQKMTPDERRQYLKDKAAAQRERQKQKLENEKRRYEDTELEAQVPLPSPKPVDVLVETFTPSEYGDILMVINFIRSYASLLTPKEELPLTPDEFARALTDSENGHAYVGKVLLILLHAIIHDEEDGFRQDIGVKLTDIELNISTVGELVRLCLRKRRHDDPGDNEEGDEEDSKSSTYTMSAAAGARTSLENADDELLEVISGTDFWDLSASSKLKLIVALANRLLTSVALENYVEDIYQQYGDALSEKNAAAQEYNKFTKEMKQENGPDESTTATSKPTPADQESISTKNPDDQQQQQIDNRQNDQEEIDIATKVKRRRLMADERAKNEAAERAKETKRKEREFLEFKMKNRLEVATKKLEESAALKKSISRIEPIGTDRNHNRYWYFGKWLPFIFVEKGWTILDDSRSDDRDDQSDQNIDRSRGDPYTETTFPKRGPNEWYYYEKLEDIDNLGNSLSARGVRESKLKERLATCYEELKKGLPVVVENGNKSSSTNDTTTATNDNINTSPPLSTDLPAAAAVPVVKKEDFSLLSDFKDKLLQLEVSIRTGGLGGVPEFDNWRSDFDSLTTIAQVGEKLLQVSLAMRPSLLCGALATPDLLQQGAQKVEAMEESTTTNTISDPPRKEKTSTAKSSGMDRWRESVRQCKTWSRLHVLMSMFRSCIRWDRSLEYAKCRICRRQQDDELALVCDTCNDVYHTYCLRPPLKRLPQGEWFCKSCKPPRNKAKSEKKKGWVEEEELMEEEKSEAVENVESSKASGNCTVCEEGEFEDQSDELITCVTCSRSFHCNCHNPPLRHKPRSSWRCSQCLSDREEPRSTRLRNSNNKQQRAHHSSRDEEDEGDGMPVKMERASATKALLNLMNRDLYDDEATTSSSASTMSSEQQQKRKNSTTA